MKVLRYTGAATPLLALVLATSVHAEPSAHIKVLATGGTIAGAQADQDKAGYKAGSFSVSDLIKAVPEVEHLAKLSGEQVANIGSQTMNDKVWLKLAKRTNQVLQDPKVDGVVVTHGTDTLEETAYFMSLVIKSDKPVVMVGSMRPATAVSADGPANLYNAVALASDPDAKGRGVLVVLNDEIHFGREAEKTNSTQLDTFHSPNRGRAGVINTGKAKLWSRLDTRYGKRSEFSVKGRDSLPRVEIVYSYANAKRDIVDYWVSKGVKGIVLAGVGDGNATDDLLAGLKDAAAKGVAVVRASRTGSGIVERNMEIDDDKMGFIASEGLNPPKARVLLMLGLTKTADTKKLHHYFMQY